MSTKALTARQARWSEVLSQYNFRIMYRPGKTNCADALTRRRQELENQAASKIALRTQALLRTENLDPQILEELSTDHPDPDVEICPIEAPELDLIDELLQANRTSASLQEFREDAERKVGQWTLENGLLKHWDRLVVAPDDNLRTRLIKEAHAQISTAHPGKTKTRKLIGDRYY